MVASKARDYLKIALLSGAGTLLVLAVWLTGVFLLATHGSQVPARVVFNGMMQIAIVLVLLPLLHRGLYRTLWRNEDRSDKGLPRIEGTYLDGNQSMPSPVPPTHKTFDQKLLYVGCYLLGMVALLWAYMPLEHSGALLHFVVRHTYDSYSAATLLHGLIMLLPLLVLLMVLMLALNRERGALARGQYSAEESLRRKLRRDWLFSFAGALVGTSVLCQIVSSLTWFYL